MKKVFNIDYPQSMSGIALVQTLGPAIEQWNKQHDRRAALHCEGLYIDGVKVPTDQTYKTASWTGRFILNGVQTSEKEMEAQQMLSNLFKPLDISLKP